MKLLGLVVLCTASLAFSPARAEQDYAALFEQSVQAVDFDFRRDWAYTETSVSEDRVWVGRYDPRRPRGQRWTLESVDGREPTEREIEDYLDERDDDEANADDEQEVENLVERDSIRLIEETDGYWLLGFIPEEDEAEFLESIDATIRISKPDGYLEYIDVHNNSTIRPTFGVRISKLITRFTFGPAAENGPIVPLSSQVEVNGQAYIFIAFDEQEMSRNSDFEYAGEDRKMVPDR